MENEVKIIDSEYHKEDKLIYQHNALTSGKFDYSACQLDILFMILSQLEQGQKRYKVYAKDIEYITGRTWNYQQLRESTEGIGSRMLEITTPEMHSQVWLFQRVEYLTGTGSFEVTLSEDALPLFFELKNNFTVLQLRSVLKCTSKHAKRIYGLCCQWRSKGRVKMEIKALKEILGLIDKKGVEQFDRVSAFKKDVLDIAKKQLNKNTNIQSEILYANYIVHQAHKH